MLSLETNAKATTDEVTDGTAKVQPSVQTLKKHINDYQLILGKEENKIHELQNYLYKERLKTKELQSQMTKYESHMLEVNELVQTNIRDKDRLTAQINKQTAAIDDKIKRIYQLESELEQKNQFMKDQQSNMQENLNIQTQNSELRTIN